MGDYSNMQGFRDPFLADARRSRQMDSEDMPQRVTTRDAGDDIFLERRGSQSNRRSMSRPSLKRPSTTSSIPMPVNYELWRFEKLGDDWSDAMRNVLSAPQKELAKKAKSGKSKNGKVLEQMQKMAPARSNQINNLVRKKYSDTGFQWEPAYIEEVKAGINRTSHKKEVRVFDLIVARAGINGSSQPSLTKTRSASVSIPRGGERVTLGRNSGRDDYYGDEQKEKKKDKDKDGGWGKQGVKKEVSDPDPHGTSKLFAPSGKPLDLGNAGHIPFDEVALPPHIMEGEPIGRRLSKNRGGKGQRDDDDDDIIQVLDDDGAFKDSAAAQILDGLDYDKILPGKSKNKKGSRSRSKSRTNLGRARSRSKSQSRSRAHAEHRGKRDERVDRYLGDRSSQSSDNGSGKSVFWDEDDDTSYTSSGIHRDMAERGSLHRRGSSKHKDLPFKEHYRGPHRDSRGYVGEQIMIAERPIRRLSTVYQPRQRQIAWDPYASGQRSPDLTRSPSPRRAYGVPELLWPQQLRDEDQRSERYVDAHIHKDRLRQLELDARERELERQARQLRRLSLGVGYVSDGRYQ